MVSELSIMGPLEASPQAGAPLAWWGAYVLGLGPLFRGQRHFHKSRLSPSAGALWGLGVRCVLGGSSQAMKPKDPTCPPSPAEQSG